MRRAPDSLPFSETETATRLPSTEGTYQSIENAPAALILLGSRMIFSELRLVAESSTIRTGCCADGSNFRANNCPRLQVIDEKSVEELVRRRVSRFSISRRAGN